MIPSWRGAVSATVFVYFERSRRFGPRPENGSLGEVALPTALIPR